MTVAEFTVKPDNANRREAILSPGPSTGGVVRRRVRVFPVLTTLAAAALAAALSWAMWNAYMGAPWTRDSTVRTYVVTLACRNRQGPHANREACNSAPSLAMGGNRHQSAR